MDIYNSHQNIIYMWVDTLKKVNNERIDYCIGICSDGMICKNKTSKSNPLCTVHQKQKIAYFNS
jgi:hypothetical protein